LQTPRVVGEFFLKPFLMKIYIAGKITGEPIDRCKVKFSAIEEALRKIGLSPVNPFKLGCKDSWSFTQCKPFNFKAIAHCQAIFMLEDFQDSPGALAELQEAKRRKLTVYYQSADDYKQLVEDLQLHYNRYHHRILTSFI
jgi:hypothetical protein